MHEYGISGAFMAKGMGNVEIKEKMFQYSCKVGEFKQIFDKDPHEASHYAEKRLMGKYSSNSVQIFTNSFRMIHELYGYCHSGSLNRDDLLQKLYLLHASFENVPEIAGDRITPLIYDGIRELDVIVDRDKFAPRFMKLCDALVELLHMEVMGAEIMNEGAYTPPSKPETPKVCVTNNKLHTGPGQKECPTCGNVIDSSNKSLLCKECGTRFCTTCEEWFREERKRGQKPLCEDCFSAEQERIAEERRQKEKEEQERKAQEEAERKKQEEERLQKEKEEQEGKARKEAERKKREKERLQKEKAEQEKKVQKEAERKKGEEEECKQKEAEERQRKVKENSFGMKFTLIPAGEFMMGSKDGNDDEQPVHKVTIKKPFYLGTYPFTQREWKAVMGDYPSHFTGDDLPVERVSWDDVQKFIRKLNEKEDTDKYRLPSESEWEYACRAGATKKYCFGDSESNLGEYAWFDDNSGDKTHPVGKKKPNPWGMYDMHGNVWEWVQDKWHDDYDGAPIDGGVWERGEGFFRMSRGGSWGSLAGYCRSANRSDNHPPYRGGNLGFRLLQEL